MSSLNTMSPPAAGLRHHQSQVPNSRASQPIQTVPRAEMDRPERDRPFIPARDLEDDDWICCRSID
jgi:hypothetical protein